MDLEIYFNEWVFLAETDPEAFERRREQYINQFLSQSGRHRQRLESLQHRIDAERKLASTPEEVLMMISELLCESLCALAGETQSLSDDARRLKTELS